MGIVAIALTEPKTEQTAEINHKLSAEGNDMVGDIKDDSETPTHH